MKLINIGFGNMVSAQRVVSIIKPDSAPVKRMIQEIREQGMLIDATYGRKTAAVLVMDSGHVVLSGINVDKIIGRQEGIQVLGRYCLDKSIAMAMKDDGGYRSVYCCTQVLRSDLLQSLAAYAGVHLYTRNDDFICANDTLVSIHAKNTGKRTLYFKAPCSPYEVSEKKFYGQNITQLELDMYLGQTLTFSVRGVC